MRSLPAVATVALVVAFVLAPFRPWAGSATSSTWAQRSGLLLLPACRTADGALGHVRTLVRRSGRFLLGLGHRARRCGAAAAALGSVACCLPQLQSQQPPLTWVSSIAFRMRMVFSVVVSAAETGQSQPA